MRDDQPVPLPRWEPLLARERHAYRRRRRPIIAFGGLGLTLLGLAVVLDRDIRPAPRLIWNASASAPIGLWHIDPGARVSAGDMVLAKTPAGVRSLVAERHYIPATVPLLKRVAAVEGDIVCATDKRILIGGHLAAVRLATDPQDRPMPWWNGCRPLGRGRFFLLNAAPDSFDSRYFGPVDRSAIIGSATPLWLR
jgi:conjugative transfer signal peptidase TraF